MHARMHARMLTQAPMNKQKPNNRQRSTHVRTYACMLARVHIDIQTLSRMN